MDNPDTAPAAAPSAWLDDLDAAEADLAAGRTCDARAFLRGLQAEDAAAAMQKQALKS